MDSIPLQGFLITDPILPLQLPMAVVVIIVLPIPLLQQVALHPILGILATELHPLLPIQQKHILPQALTM
jgi:hypothetical protein